MPTAWGASHETARCTKFSVIVTRPRAANDSVVEDDCRLRMFDILLILIYRYNIGVGLKQSLGKIELHHYEMPVHPINLCRESLFTPKINYIAATKASYTCAADGISHNPYTY